MRLLTLPGVFRPRPDSWLLADLVRDQAPAGGRVLDLCTGSGVLALSAARGGAAAVTAVDCSRRAVWTARVNGLLRGTPVEVRRGDLFGPVAGRRFDLIVTNPPYLPSVDDELPRHGPARAWEGGPDGRVLVDRICADVARHLRPGGRLLMIHSDVCGIEASCRALAAAGLEVDVPLRQAGRFGPLMRGRIGALRRRGALAGEGDDELVAVIRARRPPTPA
ncbi:HemK2/MTQ2 family protein methyltransferase [Patulibacter defluvii]|uniref:HemK2/MTQ2 family protein methyltransferase n=1 Tax=Patulibacter defluvii TaxID=3095358 RepID=UPI002A7588CE|nr:HemK2/MTQ2 family protein methyltransferase [Patulibacter sp. DM4]